MEVIYSGKEVKRLLNESIPGYKPVIGGNASSENEKINRKSNKDSIKNTQIAKPKEESKPVVGNKGQSTDIGNNKNMLDLEFDYDPGQEYKDRVKKQVTGEDSKFGNEPDGIADNKGNKAFYDAAKKASATFVKNRKDLENSGLTGKFLPVGKKQTPFKEGSETKTKRLNFKNTQFLSEKHVFSLIPEDYKKNGNKFIMRDRLNEEYLIEWKIDEKTNISEGIIVNHENKHKIQEEFDRIKKLYEYKSKDHAGNLTNEDRKSEEDQISKGIKKLKEISDNE
jgi:hypothetical protein